MLDPIVSLSVALAEGPGTYAVLLGAGASRDAGVPTGQDVLWQAVADLYRVATTSTEVPERVELEDWLRGLGEGEWTYSRVLEELAPDPATRRDYLAQHFEGREPAETHHHLAALAAEGYVRVFITPNFDRLLEHALNTQGIEPVVITADDDLATAIPREHADCLVLKPHGDYLQQTIRNTAAELAELTPAIDRELREIVNRYGVIVTGWAGADPGITSALRARGSRYGLYWQARGSLSTDAQALVEAAGGRVVTRPTAADFLRDLRARLAVWAVHPDGLTPATVHEQVLAALRGGDPVRVGEIMRTERNGLEQALRDGTRGRENELLTDENVREFHDRVAPSLERRLLSILPLVDYDINQLERELEHLAALYDRRPRVGGTVFWLYACDWPAWWLTHAVGAYALRTWNTAAMRALLRATVIRNGKPRPLADGFPGETTHRIGELMASEPQEGRRWIAPEWEYLAASLEGNVALAERYQELVSAPDDPRRAVGEWNFILDLALGLRDRGSVAYWQITPNGAQEIALRLHADRELRARLAEDILGIAIDELDEKAAAALQLTSPPRVGVGDDDAISLFLTGTA